MERADILSELEHIAEQISDLKNRVDDEASEKQTELAQGYWEYFSDLIGVIEDCVSEKIDEIGGVK